MTAIPEEFKAAVEHLREVREVVGRNGVVYSVGSFGNNSTAWEVWVAQTGKGNENAAALATAALIELSPTVAFFVGVAGGLKDVSHGDVVAADRVIGYEHAKTTETMLSRFEHAASSFRVFQRAVAEARDGRWTNRILGERAAATPTARVGPIAAGSKVIASTQSQVYAFLRQNCSEALAVEMEGLGFLKAAYAHQEAQALVVRGISDLIDGKGESDRAGLQTVASRHATAFAFEVLERYGEAQSASKPKHAYAIRIKVDSLDSDQLEALLETLRTASRDPTLEVTRIETGSIILHLRGSEEGHQRLLTLFRAGMLSRLLGHEVLGLTGAIERPVALAGDPLTWYRLRELHSGPYQFGAPALGLSLAAEGGEGLRALLHRYYAEVYGREHLLTKALSSTSPAPYFRPQSLSIYQHLLLNSDPIIAFIPPFASERDFYEYFGVTASTFLQLAEAGLVLPTVAPITNYRSSFAKEFLHALLRLPEDRRPAGSAVHGPEASFIDEGEVIRRGFAYRPGRRDIGQAAASIASVLQLQPSESRGTTPWNAASVEFLTSLIWTTALASRGAGVQLSRMEFDAWHLLYRETLEASEYGTKDMIDSLSPVILSRKPDLIWDPALRRLPRGHSPEAATALTRWITADPNIREYGSQLGRIRRKIHSYFVAGRRDAAGRRSAHEAMREWRDIHGASEAVVVAGAGGAGTQSALLGIGGTVQEDVALISRRNTLDRFQVGIDLVQLKKAA